MSLGEGAAVFVLETLEMAQARGATPLCELAGYGTTSDAFDPLRADVEGPTRCMQLALASADIEPPQVNYLNAHGTATYANDITESEAMRAVFGETPPPVSSTKPVHGHALGGGMQIALGADIRYIHPDTQLSVRDVHWGLIPDMTGTLMLSRLVRPDIAKELVFSAKIISGKEGYEIGLATHLSENPHADAMVLAREIAGRSPDAVRGAKKLLNLQVNDGAAQQFANEREVIGRLIGHANQAEAVMSHFEKRPPNFQSASLF
jgi:hypothetical protein